MPIEKHTAYIPVCDNCKEWLNIDWTRFKLQDTIDDLESSDYGFGQYNKKTGKFICWRCLERYPELIEADEEE